MDKGRCDWSILIFPGVLQFIQYGLDLYLRHGKQQVCFYGQSWRIKMCGLFKRAHHIHHFIAWGDWFAHADLSPLCVMLCIRTNIKQNLCTLMLKVLATTLWFVQELLFADILERFWILKEQKHLITAWRSSSSEMIGDYIWPVAPQVNEIKKWKTRNCAVSALLSK